MFANNFKINLELTKITDLHDEAIKQIEIMFQNKDLNIVIDLKSQLSYLMIDKNVYN